MNPLPGAQSLKVKALKRAQPLSALIELTYRCNWRCGFCYNPRHFDFAPLSTAEWIGVLDGLRELGTLTVALTGGEPTARPDFFDIAGAARERAFAIRIFTNGSLLDGVSAEKIARLRPLGVELSLHGATAATHEAATGMPGSFRALLRGLDALCRAGAPVLLKTPLTNRNETELDAMIAIAAERGVPYQVDPSITPRDDGDRSPLAHAATRRGQLDLFRRPELARSRGETERERGGVNCGLGRLTIAVDPEGNVFPCAQWRHEALGNVRQVPLPEIWRESSVRSSAAEIAVAANDRLLDEGGPVATHAFCPALALRMTGDPLVPDPATRARAELVRDARLSSG